MLGPGSSDHCVEMSMKTMFKKRQGAPSVVMSTLVALLLSPAIQAASSFQNTFESLYGNSASGANGDCQICHADSTRNLNSYGKSFCDQGGNTTARLQSIENLDSDSDPTGSSNIDEIMASTQPGWTPGDVNPIYSRGNCSPTGLTEAPPSWLSLAEIDPVGSGNNAPVANNDDTSTAFNSPVTVDVLANDYDTENDVLMVVRVSPDGSTNGSVSNNTADVTYTPDTNFCGIASFQYQASDGTDSSNNATVTVTVGDTNAPVTTAPTPNLTIMLPPGSTGIPTSDQQIANWLESATATDAEEGDVPVRNNAPTSFGVGTTPLVFSASDACGNSDTATANVIVQVADNNVPVVMAPTPDPLVLTAPQCATSMPRTDADISEWLTLASASDAEDGTLNVSNNTPSDLPVGNTAVTFSATDKLGATGSANATITVNATPNATPVVNAPTPISITVPSGTTSVPVSDPAIQAFLAAAGATDTEDGNLDVTHDAPAEFLLGETTVTFTATDSCGSSGIGQSTVTIAEDQPVKNGPPQLSAPASITVDSALCGISVPATDPVIQAFLGGATATDAEDGDLSTWISNDASSDFQAAIAPGVTTTVTFSVTDSGNPTGTPMTSTTTSTVTVVDPNTAPQVNAAAALTLTVPVGTGTVPASDPAIAAFLASATAEDGQDGSLAVSNDAPVIFEPGTTTVVFSSTDACGLTATTSSTLTIQEEGSADVSLARLVIRKGDIGLRVGDTTSKRVVVKGKAGSVAQDATVILSVDAPSNVSVMLTPDSMTREVSPDSRVTRFSFDADISCDGAGGGTLTWTAVIDAAQNSDATNDTLTSTTSVRCEGNMDSDDEPDEDEHSDDEHSDDERDRHNRRGRKYHDD